MQNAINYRNFKNSDIFKNTNKVICSIQNYLKNAYNIDPYISGGYAFYLYSVQNNVNINRTNNVSLYPRDVDISIHLKNYELDINYTMNIIYNMINYINVVKYDCLNIFMTLPEELFESFNYYISKNLQYKFKRPAKKGFVYEIFGNENPTELKVNFIDYNSLHQNNIYQMITLTLKNKDSNIPIALPIEIIIKDYVKLRFINQLRKMLRFDDCNIAVISQLHLLYNMLHLYSKYNDPKFYNNLQIKQKKNKKIDIRDCYRLKFFFKNILNHGITDSEKRKKVNRCFKFLIDNKYLFENSSESILDLKVLFYILNYFGLNNIVSLNNSSKFQTYRNNKFSYLKNILNSYKNKSINSSFNNEVNYKNSIRNNVGNAIRNNVENVVGNTVGNAIRNNVENAVGKTVGNTVENAVGKTVGNTVGNAIRNNVENAISNTIRNKVNNTQIKVQLTEEEIKKREKIKAKKKAYEKRKKEALREEKIRLESIQREKEIYQNIINKIISNETLKNSFLVNTYTSILSHFNPQKNNGIIKKNKNLYNFNCKLKIYRNKDIHNSISINESTVTLNPKNKVSQNEIVNYNRNFISNKQKMDYEKRIQHILRQILKQNFSRTIEALFNEKYSHSNKIGNNEFIFIDMNANFNMINFINNIEIVQINPYKISNINNEKYKYNLPNINHNETDDKNNGILIIAFDYDNLGDKGYKVIDLYVKNFNNIAKLEYYKLDINFFNNKIYDEIYNNFVNLYTESLIQLFELMNCENKRLVVSFKINIIKVFDKYNYCLKYTS